MFINLDNVVWKEKSKTLGEAVNEIEPFRLSEDVISNKASIIADVPMTKNYVQKRRHNINKVI